MQALAVFKQGFWAGMLLFGVNACKQGSNAAPPASGVASLSSAADPNDPAQNTRNWDEVPASKMPQEKDYKLVPFPSNEVEKTLPISKGANGVPHDFDGIWWTDGDTFPIKALSMANAAWDAANRRVVLPVFDADTYTYVGNDGGSNLWKTMLALHLVYEVNLASDMKSGSIVPVIVVAGRHVRMPNWIAKFTMTYDSDGLWMRQSWFFGQRVPDYKFTRIVKGDGTRDLDHNRAYERYLMDATGTSFIIKPATGH